MRLAHLFGALTFLTVQHAWAAPKPAIVLQGQGVQIYDCTEGEAGYAWRLKAPDAILTDAAGHPAGHHFAGPSWQAEDGSVVKGEPLVTSNAPEAGSIPWLVLAGKVHTGEGLFAGVAYIVRSDTKGGLAPATGCDQAHKGSETKVDYSATYTFFPS